MPNQASLVTLRSQPGRLPLSDDIVGKDDLIADERARRRRAGDREQARAGAGAEAAAHAGELHDAETLHEVLERQILAERHEMDLVVAVEDLALVVDHEQAVIDARRDEAILRVALLDNPAEPTSKLVPSGSRSPMAVSASEESASRKGTAVSGQITSEMPSRPGVAAAGLGEIEIVVEDLGAVLRAPFIGLIDIGLDDAKPHAGGGQIGALQAAPSPHAAPSAKRNGEGRA